MLKGVTSLSLRSNRKSSALGPRLVAGFSEALAHARGELELPSYTVTRAGPRAPGFSKRLGDRQDR
jgi:hypothetical protein